MTGSSRHKSSRRFSLAAALRARRGHPAPVGEPATRGPRPLNEPREEGPIRDQKQLVRELDREIERAKRGSRRLSVLVGQLGPAARFELTSQGARDPLLDRACTALAEQKRQIDVLAALGQGRFVLILPETVEPGALMVAERLRAAVAGVLRSESGTYGMSFGIASFGRHGRNAAALLGAAERAAFAARELERDGSLIDRAEIAAAMAAVTGRSSEQAGRLETVLSLAETVDIRDRGIAGHSQVVGRYAKLIARELGLSDEATERVRLAGVLHDVGKVGVSRPVLQKPGPLSDEEWQAVREHSRIGARILEASPTSDIGEWVLHHHERIDGTGYPNGLRGRQIPLEARIVAVADAYEAMTSDRVHQGAVSHDRARAELLECAGTQFDQRVVEAFARALDRQGLGSSSAAA